MISIPERMGSFSRSKNIKKKKLMKSHSANNWSRALFLFSFLFFCFLFSYSLFPILIEKIPISQNNSASKYVIFTKLFVSFFSFFPLDLNYSNECSYLTNLFQTFPIFSTNNRDNVSWNNYFNSGARYNSWTISSA